MILVRKQTMDGFLTDRTLPHYQPFANPMARFRRRQLLQLLLTYECARPFLQRTVFFAVILTFQRPFSDSLKGRRRRPFLFMLLLAGRSRLPHQRPLPTYLHF